MNFYVPIKVVPNRPPILKKILLVMRLSCLLLLVGMLHANAKGVSQTISYTGKGVSLETLFSVIKEQTGYVVFYKYNTVRNSKPVTVNVKGAPLKMFLDKVLEGQHLDFKIMKETIIVSASGAAPEDIMAAIPPSDVKGRLLDQQDKPIQGAFVRIKSGNGFKTAVTNENGEFVLAGVNAYDTLRISSVNIEPITYALNGRTSVTVKARIKTSDLDSFAIQVYTGYQALPKERATGSFGIVTSKQLSQYPVVSVLERMQGLVPGMDIFTKTTAGRSRAGSVTIRGMSTILNTDDPNARTGVSPDPLLVIDGFPSQISISEGAMNFLNPDDIEQITVLKDAAAASIWGMQAANGVIVVVTKKGVKNSRPVFNFSATLGTSKRPKANYGKMMSVPDYIAMEKELFDKNVFFDPVTNTSTFFPVNNSQAQAILFAQKRGEITLEQRDAQLEALGKIDNSDQISEYLLQPPVTRQYNLSVSGGGINNSYFLSGYFYTDDRAYKSNTNKGYSFKASNVSNFLNGKMSLSTDLTFSNTNDKINGSAVRAMSIADGGMRVYDKLKDDNGNNVYYDVVATPQKARSLESKGYLPFSYSPIDELNYSNTTNTSSNLTLNVAMTGHLTSWLSVNASGNFGRVFTDGNVYWEPNSYDARMMVNKGTSINSSGARVYGVPAGGRLTLTRNLEKTYNARGQFVVNKSWTEKHKLNFLAGMEIRERVSSANGEIRYGYDKETNTFRNVNPSVSYVDMYQSTQNGIGATSLALSDKTTRTLSYYGNFSYTFLNKYILSGSARMDDNNLLGVDRSKRAVPLWSVGGKWNAKQENFMRNISWLNQLSLRATFGFSGNAPQLFAPVTVINILGNDYYSGYNYAGIASPAVDNLAWEKTRMINYGIDYSFLNSRVFGSIEYYRKKTTDIIWSMPINGTYGFTSTLFNTAKLDGKGVDISLNVVPVQSKQVRWVSNINLSYNTNVIKDSRFEKPITSFGTGYLYNGYPTDYLFSYVWGGLDKTGQSLIKDPKDPGKVYTINEYPFEGIRKYSGRTKSPWFGGWNNNIQYKDFEFGFQFVYNFGGVFRKPSMTSIGYSNNTMVGRVGEMAERWKQPGDEARTNVPGLIFGTGANFYASSSRYIESDYLIRSRSNIKLQQISLSYKLPQQLISKVGLTGMTLSAVCRNLGMIWAANKDNLDPDYTYTTGNNYQLAPVPAYTFRASVNF